MIQFTVFGTPKPAGSKRAFVRGKRAMIVDANPNAKDWKASVAQAGAVAMAGRPLLDGPLVVGFAFYFPRPKGHTKADGTLNAKGRRTPYPNVKPDATKLVRGTEDALTGIIWRDDAQIVVQMATKHYGEPARCEIIVSEAA